MTAFQSQKFTLVPHHAVENHAVRSIGGAISRIPGGLRVSYVLEGDLEQLRVPQCQEPRLTDELWRHTCFEMFIVREGDRCYHEFNFSPSGEWAVYAFSDYRQRAPLKAGVEVAALDPGVTAYRSEGKLELDAVVHLDRLSPHCTGGILVLALSSVIEARDGSLSYWALKHPLPKPDFHHPDAFVLELDEIRN